MTTQEFPTLFKKGIDGRKRFWRILRTENSYLTEHGYVGGKTVTNHKRIDDAEGVIKKAKKLWDDKKSKEMYTESSDCTPSLHDVTTYRPMLAHEYSPSKLNFPCFVQPKLDGLRCMCFLLDGKPVMISRKGIPFEGCPHITQALSIVLKDHPHIVLDGELYSETLPFQMVAGLLKKKYLTEEDRTTIRQNIFFYCFDTVFTNDLSVSFQDRFVDTWRVVLGRSRTNTILRPIDTDLVNEHEIEDALRSFIQQGFEGIILRNRASVYKLGYRSHDLQKKKTMHEDEFEIVGFTSGEGRETDAVIWECKLPTNDTRFYVRPKGTLEDRKQMFKEASDHIGKPLTVIFQELQPSGVPRFPIGKCIRCDI